MSAPAKPRAWLREPKVQRHQGRHLVRGVSTFEPTAEEREFAELDGDVLVPLYDQAEIDSAVAAERERCAKLARHKALHCEEHENPYGQGAALDIEDAIRGGQK